MRFLNHGFNDGLICLKRLGTLMQEARGVSMREELGDRNDVCADSEINGARQNIINTTVVKIDSKTSLFSICQTHVCFTVDCLL